jgi:CRP-like cAMP-binding protein
VVLKKDSIIMSEGQYNTHLYRIKSGVIRIEKLAKHNNSQHPIVLGKLVKNQVFGEMSFIEDKWLSGEGGNVTASCVVESETAELYQIDRSFIFSLFLVDKDLFKRFYQIIALMLAERIVNLPMRHEIAKLKGTETTSLLLSKKVRKI